MRLRGAFPTAEEEAPRACEELPRFNFVYGLGYAFAEIGEIRRRMGDFAGAEEAYGRAHEYGGNPEPGRSLIRLAQGKLDAAVAGVRRRLAEEKDPLSRIQPLVAQAEIAIAAGEVETGAAAADELESIAELYGAALPTVAAGVRGTVRLAQGDAEGAVPDLRKALHGWQEIDAPYEAAEIRVQLGRAYHAVGDQDAAQMELQAARSTFERLGARWAEGRTGELLNELMPAATTTQRVRRTFMFTDIVKSTDLVGAIGDEAWENLLSWHDQTLRAIFAAHAGEVAHPTGDGFFVTFEDAAAASPAPSPSSAHSRSIDGPRGSLRSSGSGFMRPRPLAEDRTTAGERCTGRRGSPRWPRQARSWPARRPWPTRTESSAPLSLER